MLAARVSVVIPLYNAASYIQETLDSIAAQDHPPHEVIVVDDGSSDGGAAIARGHPVRPRVLAQPNRGPAAARNAAVEIASGDLIALVDADDLWQPHKLARQVTALQERPDVAWSCTHYQTFVGDTPGRRTFTITRPLEHPPTLLAMLEGGNQVGSSTVVVRRDAWRKVGGMDEGRSLLPGGEDFHLWLRLARLHPPHYDPEVLTSYRVRTTGLVGADWRRAALFETRAIASFLAAEPDLARALFGSSSRAFQLSRVPRLVARWKGSRRAVLRPRALLTVLRCWAELAGFVRA